jgi:PAB1-binding protein PBP1
LFGAKTDYDEDLYTTKLNRSGANFKQREAEAERLAKEILNVSCPRSNASAPPGPALES